MPQFRLPLARELVAYWKSRQINDGIPHTSDFFDHLPAPLAPYLILFDWSPDDIICRLLGTKLVERWAEDLTGKSWFSANPHLKASGIVANFKMMIDRPCGGHAHGSFVSTVGRHLSIETVSLPLAVSPGRAPRVVAGSFPVETLGTDERSRGWIPPRQLEWLDLGFGIPDRPPAAAA